MSVFGSDQEAAVLAHRRRRPTSRVSLVLGLVLSMVIGAIAVSTAAATPPPQNQILSDLSASIGVGSLPTQLVVNSTGAKAYVINAGSSSVSVIDTATNTVTATVSTGTGTEPKDLALTRDDSKLYVIYDNMNSGYAENGGYVEISTATNTVTYTSGHLDYLPVGIAVNADGTKLYINANQTLQSDPFGDYFDYIGQGTRIYSNSTHAGIGWIPTQGSTYALAVSPDGSTLYRTDSYDQSLQAIDITGGNGGWSTLAWQDGMRIAVSPNNSKVYLLQSGYVAIFDVATQQIIEQNNISSAGTGFTVSPDGSYLYVSDTYGAKVRVVSTSAWSVLATVTFPLGSRPWGVAAAPGGSAVYVASNGAAAVRVLTAAPSVVAPAAPTALNATPGNASASITFTAGADGGAAISKYQYSTDGGSNWSDAAAGTTSPVTVSGLTNGTSYSIKLRAVNSAGGGAASDAVSVTPRTTPSAPTALVATPGDGSASIAFTAGADGGAAISKYQYSTDGGTTWADADAGTTSPVTISGLSNYTSYSIKLRAVNSVGAGAASSAVSVRPGLPGAVSCAGNALGKHRLQLCWNLVTPSQGSVVRYRATVFLVGTSTKVATCRGSSTDTSCDFGSPVKLAAGTTYDFRVGARIKLAPGRVFWSLYGDTRQVTTLP